MSLWILGLALASDLDLVLERAEAARDVGDWDAAVELAAEALEVDPHDSRSHFAWQTALIGSHQAWRLDAEYAWLLEGPDERLSELAEGWVQASGKPVVAMRLRSEDEELRAQFGIQSAMKQGDLGELRRRGKEALERWPHRPDLLVPMLHDRHVQTRGLRRDAARAADTLVESGDVLDLYRALEVYVALGDEESAREVIDALHAAGEVFPMTAHRAWKKDLMSDMGKLLALQETPQLPPGHLPHEEQWALAYAAKTLQEKGRYERAAETWRRALAADEPTPMLLLRAAQGIERGGASPEEVLALSEQAVDALTLRGDTEHLGEALHLQARALRALERPDEALRAATLASGLGQAHALVLRGELLELAGEPALAFDAYAQAAALGVPGLEQRLEGLYRGPASWQAVVASWPLAEGTKSPKAPAPFPRERVGEVVMGQGSPVVVNFWASWCAPCVEELPRLDALASEGAVIVAVSIDGTPEDMEQFLEEHPYEDLVVVWDPALAKEVDVAGIPTTLIVDSAGLVAYRNQGYLVGDLERLAHELERLTPIQEEPSPPESGTP